jgi:hypothetical protein
MQDEIVNIPAYQRVNRKASVFQKLRGFFDDISHSPNGMDQLFVNPPIDFVSQPRDSHLYHIGLGIEVVVPHMFHNHCFGDDPPFIPHKVFKERKL